ncbi:MAG: hypothetical protein PHF67_05305 [Candidatus Nanoarchaeia archaeon]|nr:hypothetical protein [Candidatus Nanoarchaeia archaeon]
MTTEDEKLLIMDSVDLKRLTTGVVIVRRNGVVFENRPRDLGIAVSSSGFYYGPNHYSVLFLSGTYDTNDPDLYMSPDFSEAVRTCNLFEIAQNETRRISGLPLIEARHFFARDRHDDPLLVVLEPGPEKRFKEDRGLSGMPIGFFIECQDYIYDMSVDDLRPENSQVEEKLKEYSQELAGLKPEINLSVLSSFRARRKEFRRKRGKANRFKDGPLGFDLLN